MAELSWGLDFDGYKGILGIGDAPDVVNSILRGESRGKINGNEWRLRLLENGNEVSLDNFNGAFRSILADSVARRIIEDSKEHDAKIERLKKKVREAWDRQ